MADIGRADCRNVVRAMAIVCDRDPGSHGQSIPSPAGRRRSPINEFIDRNAVRSLHTYLNLSWLDAPGPTAALAAFHELPPAYLNKQLQALVRATAGVRQKGVSVWSAGRPRWPRSCAAATVICRPTVK